MISMIFDKIGKELHCGCKIALTSLRQTLQNSEKQGLLSAQNNLTNHADKANSLPYNREIHKKRISKTGLRCFPMRDVLIRKFP